MREATFFALTVGVLLLVIALMSYSVVDAGIVRYDPSTGEYVEVVRRPFEQPAQVLGTVGVILIFVGFAVFFYERKVISVAFEC